MLPVRDPGRASRGARAAARRSSSAPRACSRGAALLGQSRGWLIALPLVAWWRSSWCPGGGARSSAFAAVGAGLLMALDPLLDVYTRLAAVPAARRAVRAALRRCCWPARLVRAGHRGGRARPARALSAGARAGSAAAMVAAVALARLLRARRLRGGRAQPDRRRPADDWDEFKQGGNGPQTVGRPLQRERLHVPLRLLGGRPGDEFKGLRCWEPARTTSGGPTRVEGQSAQTPRYPHSTELVALAETGLIGALLCGRVRARRWWPRCRCCAAAIWAAPRPAPAC